MKIIFERCVIHRSFLSPNLSRHNIQFMKQIRFMISSVIWHWLLASILVQVALLSLMSF